MLSTIHTNSASGAIPRFLSMGVKAFLMAPALNCVIGQRLVRKLCDCKVEIELTPEQKEKVAKFLENLPEGEKSPEIGEKFYGPGKCEKCSNLGYKGRLGIYEIFIMIPEIEQLIVTGNVGESDIEQIAVKNGMATMVQDGILKAMEGLTSIDEVFRVIG
ncbi:MAG: type II secretion system protein GspE, partial [Candidatus Magasanikbacteria bacterium CG_4_9_14_3_um_filter_32_9]